MKSRSEIWLCALIELGAQCSVETQRDVKTMTDRVAAEGESFFTTTLPKFGKDLEMALALQRITPELFQGFKRRRLHIDVYNDDWSMGLYELDKPGGTPQFLGGFLDLLFDNTLATREAELDLLLLSPVKGVPRLKRDFSLSQADAIAAIRQLTLMFGKEKGAISSCLCRSCV
jgi:hypothetical protein